jgi:nucleoid-associated protein YgaU
MGNGAKIGLVGVLALIVLVVAIWDRSNEESLRRGDLGEVATAPPEITDALPRVRNQLDEAAAGDRILGEIDQAGPLRLPSARPQTGASSGVAGVAAMAPEVQGVEAEAGVAEVSAPTPAVEPSAPDGGGAAPSTDSTAEPDAGVLARYTVKPGDTLSKIASRFYGSGRKYYPIVKANRDRLPNPDVLPLGVELVIPKLDGAASTASAPSTASAAPGPSASGSGRTHVVQPGDTLYRLATRYLGTGTQFKRIYEANRDRMRSPDDLRVGMRIVIPNS